MPEWNSNLRRTAMDIVTLIRPKDESPEAKEECRLVRRNLARYSVVMTVCDKVRRFSMRSFRFSTSETYLRQCSNVFQLLIICDYSVWQAKKNWTSINECTRYGPQITPARRPNFTSTLSSPDRPKPRVHGNTMGTSTAHSSTKRRTDKLRFCIRTNTWGWCISGYCTIMYVALESIPRSIGVVGVLRLDSGTVGVHASCHNRRTRVLLVGVL